MFNGRERKYDVLNCYEVKTSLWFQVSLPLLSRPDPTTLTTELRVTYGGTVANQIIGTPDRISRTICVEDSRILRWLNQGASGTITL